MLSTKINEYEQVLLWFVLSAVLWLPLPATEHDAGLCSNRNLPASNSSEPRRLQRQGTIRNVLLIMIYKFNLGLNIKELYFMKLNLLFPSSNPSLINSRARHV